jgi:magnesium transporter
MEQYSEMLNRHLIVATFVTTLIGTGGNAGNQASALVISGIGSGEIKLRRRDVIVLLRREIISALLLSILLSCTTFLRVYLASGQVKKKKNLYI